MKDAVFESEVINELQVRSREIQADILYNITWKRQSAILHAEFQRRHDADIGRRVWIPCGDSFFIYWRRAVRTRLVL